MSLKNKFDKTNLDLESPKPQGGPNSFPDHNHQQKYTPNNTYLDTKISAASPKSDFGIEGDQIQNPVNVFSKTNLDLENLPAPGIEEYLPFFFFSAISFCSFFY